MILRDYQALDAAAIEAAWAAGHKNVAYVLPCRGGKTAVVANKILANVGGTVAIAHRGFLVAQMSTTLARNGVRHRIIGPDTVVRECVQQHLAKVGKNYISNSAKCAVATIQTLVRMPENDPFFSQVTLWVCDEMHHLARKNIWGKGVALFPNARGLGVTATPTRADGLGLGRHADGVMDTMVIGPRMTELTRRGFIAPYRIFCPPSDLDLSNVAIGASGEFEVEPLRKAVHKSHVVGDIVQHYLRIAPGKLGMTFAVDVEGAVEIAAAYRSAGVPAEVVHGGTPASVRLPIEARHQNGDIKQLVSVDIYGEGTDIQKLEVVSFGRPTGSYGLYVQQFCRPLNPDPTKSHALILDHVGNVGRHGLPDAHREWTLDRREKRSRGTVTDVMPIRVCPQCTGAYEADLGLTCPYCGHSAEPAGRSLPEQVDGDLYELTPEALARLRGEIDKPPSEHPSMLIQASINARHREAGEAQRELRAAMAEWAAGMNDLPRAWRRFYLTFGCDVLTAQSLGRADAELLTKRIKSCNT